MTSTLDIGTTSSRSESEASNPPGPEKQPQPRPESDTSHTQDGDCEDCAQALAISSTHSKQDSDMRPSRQTDQLHQLPSGSFPANENEEIVITALRANDVALGLRRLPAGFFAVLHHNGLQWRTENKPSSVNHDIVEWDEPIPISSDISATIRFEICASFEIEPMLGSGEQLQELTVTVKRLLELSETNSPFTFSSKDGDIGCSSIFVAVKRLGRENPSQSTQKPPNCHWLSPEPCNQLENVTNQGHYALLQHQKHGEKLDLERSVREFEHALSICPSDHPCRAAAQSNLAMAELICFQMEGVDTRLEVALRLYRDALAARPLGHPDRPSTLIHLATVHLVRFQNLKDNADEQQARRLLDEALGSESTTHARRAASILHQPSAGQNVGRMQPDWHSSLEQNAALRLTHEDPWRYTARLMERFQRLGDLGDLERAITVFSELLRSTATRDSRYPVALHNLGAALLYRFGRLGQLADLEDAISRFKNAVDLTPPDDPHKPVRLNNLGNSLRIRFERLGQLSDLEDAISIQRDAINLTPLGHPDRPGRLHNLGLSCSTRFEWLSQLSDLQDAISSHRDAVDFTPHGHPNKPAYLNHFGNTLKTRFERLGQFSDLEDAISNQRDAVDLTPHDHPDISDYLNDLGSSLSTRFKHCEQLRDLEEAISRLRNAVELTPLGYPQRSIRLSDLGNALNIRFEWLGELGDSEEAISRLRDAVTLAPHGHPDRPYSLNNLSNSLLTRFQHLGQLIDLEDAISILRDVVDLTPHRHPDKPVRLNNLGDSLRTRFECLGELSDLEEAVSRFRDAVELTPDGHPRRCNRLNSLGDSLRVRFTQLGHSSDLEDAISKLRDAVDLTPHGHPHRAGHLSNLGNSFLTRFEHLGQLSDLEDATSCQREATDLTPHGHPQKCSRLNNLGSSLQTRFQRLGQLSDLEEAISRNRDTVDLTPSDHPDKPMYLNNLGNSFLFRFESLGQLSDLEVAISCHRDAVDLTPHNHPQKPAYLDNLGKSLKTRFQRRGQLIDLEDSISRSKDAVDLTPYGHLNKLHYLNNRGNYFLIRFSLLGELSDLEDAISNQKIVVDLTPYGHPYKPDYLNNLGNSLKSRFLHLGEPSDLEDAISRLRDAVDLAPHDHPHKPGYLGNLGISLKTRFEYHGQLSDLEDAISIQMAVVELTPHDHPQKPNRLNNLATSIKTRFMHFGEPSDFEQAVSRLRDAVDLIPHGHPLKPTILTHLGTSFTVGFEPLGETKLEQAISILSHAASSPIGPIHDRFRASQEWISCAHRIRHPSLLHAYSVALNLLPQLAWIGLPLAHRYAELIKGANIAREAAAAVLDAGFTEVAVEWLEQGRSIVWGELFELRSSYAELSSSHPDYARRLRELSTELDQASAVREMISVRNDRTPPAVEMSRQVADRQRRLALDRDQLLQEVRRLPGFEQFLRPKRFSQLRASAHAGPVVILNAAETRCDALVVLADVDHVIHVSLTEFTYQQSTGLQNIMKDFVREARVGARATLPMIDWESILSTLWTKVVKPVLDALAFSEPGDLSRIFWCPTGPFAFLPIHAAGLYGTQYAQPGRKLSDFQISSYVPTLSILAPSSNLSTAPTSDLRLLAVRQPPSDGLVPLSGVGPELDHIRKVIENSPAAQTIFVASSQGTVEEVLDFMKDADWVHFACHGVQDTADPIESGLCLANERRLALRDIIALNRPRGGLAFLSACETAKGDRDLSDEAAHIAAGMLFAGYGGVVGTMWSISDRLAPRVAKEVYAYLFRDGRRPDYREAARALHEAVGRARREGASFSNWIPFIHLGL